MGDGFPNPINQLLAPNANTAPLALGGVSGQATDLFDVFLGPGFVNKALWIDPAGGLHCSSGLAVPSGNIVNGGILLNQSGGVIFAINHYTSAQTLSTNQQYVACDATSGAFAITLPSTGLLNGIFYEIIKIDSSANAITISGNGKNINGAASQTLATQFNKMGVIYDATAGAWFQVI